MAQRARAASRILEAQVGTNPRIRVQQDDAFVLWDKITFNDDSGNHHSGSPASGANKPADAPSSPEWVRRTICCAKWEVDNATATVGVTASDDPATTNTASATAPTPAVGARTRAKSPPTVVLAILSTATVGMGSDVSPRNQTLKLSESPPEPQSLLLNPVPLPGPPHPHAMSHGHGHGTNKFEPRVTGTLVARWADKAGIKLLEVEPTRHGGVVGIVSDDEGRGGRARGGHVGKARRGSCTDGNGGGLGVTGGGGGMGAGLVERPPAVRAMMEMVAQQPANTRVVRVLARGEKLDPDP